jgi:hypothetical protein
MKQFMIMMIALLGLSAHAAKYSAGKVKLSYGSLGVGAGSGKVYITADENNKFQKLSIDVTAGMLGIEERIQESISLSRLKSGKALEFEMAGADKPALKIIADKNFDEDGGKATMKFLTKNGYQTVKIELARGSRTKKFAIWKGDNKVESISVNMRGYKIKDMYVGKYRIYTY